MIAFAAPAHADLAVQENEKGMDGRTLKGTSAGFGFTCIIGNNWE